MVWTGREKKLTLLMNLLVTDGIVMASDGLLTLEKNVNNQIYKFTQSTTLQKTYHIAEANIGISFHGATTVNGVSITKYLNEFIREKSVVEEINIDNAAETLLAYFKNVTPTLADTSFYIGGFRLKDGIYYKVLYRLNLMSESTFKTHDDEEGNDLTRLAFGGNVDILRTLVNPVKIDKQNDPQFSGYSYHLYTIQDAIDFCFL